MTPNHGDLPSSDGLVPKANQRPNERWERLGVFPQCCTLHLLSLVAPGERTYLWRLAPSAFKQLSKKVTRHLFSCSPGVFSEKQGY